MTSSILPFFFLLGPFVFTKVVTCKTNGSNVFSTDMVRMTKFFGSHFTPICPNSPSVPIFSRNLMVKIYTHKRMIRFGSSVALRDFSHTHKCQSQCKAMFQGNLLFSLLSHKYFNNLQYLHANNCCFTLFCSPFDIIFHWKQFGCSKGCVIFGIIF